MGQYKELVEASLNPEDSKTTMQKMADMDKNMVDIVDYAAAVGIVKGVRKGEAELFKYYPSMVQEQCEEVIADRMKILKKEKAYLAKLKKHIK